MKQEVLAPAAPASGASLRAYVVGNAGALLIGLLAGYFTLTARHAISTRVINIRTVDLMAYYAPARMVLAGHAGLVYNWAALGHVQTALVGHTATTFGLLPDLYPPFFVTAFLPLATLPYNLTYLVWLSLSCVLIVVALYAFEQYIGLEGRKAAAFRWVSLTFSPVFLAFVDGQVSMYLLALLAAAFFAIRSNRPLLAGAALAAVCVKPTYVAPILLVLLLRRQWRAVASFAASGLLLLLAPMVVFGPRIYKSYLQLLAVVSAWQGRSTRLPLWYHHLAISPATYGSQWNQSVAGFVDRLLPNPESTILYAALGLALLAVLAACTLHCRTIDIPFGMAVVAGLLVSPHTLAYDLTLLLLPVAVVLRYRHTGLRVHRWVLPSVLIFGYLTIVVGYFLALFFPIQFPVLGMAGLMAWMWVLAYRVPTVVTQHSAIAEVRRADSSKPMVGLDTA